jgi:polyisoprenoid-binding protein YceI
MVRRCLTTAFTLLLTVGMGCTLADAQARNFKVNYTSRATFRTEAPLETIVGTTGGDGAVTGNLTIDPARPQDARGTIKVDLNALKTGIDQRDAAMRGKNFLDSETSETNRYAVFEVKGAEISGPLEPGKSTPGKVRGTLTVRGKPVETAADVSINYVKLTPEQAEPQKRFGFTTENIRANARFQTSFTNHGMQVPQLLILKVSNDIQLETDLVLVLAQ